MQAGVVRVDRVDANTALESARAAWHRGDFSTCLAALDTRSPRRSAERAEALLLRGRALLRLDRCAEAVAALESLEPFQGVDERCTARMLHGSAVARAQDWERGLSLLDAVAGDAAHLGAHAAIRAEIEYYRALAYWARRDHGQTLRHALVAESGGADIISARAAALRGWVANAKGAYPEALQLFRSALASYRRCRELDVHLAALLVQTIAYLEVDLYSATSCHVPEIPAESDLPGAPFELDVAPVPRLQAATHVAWLYALQGDSFNAYLRAREALRLAHTDAWRVYALAESAAIAAAFEENISARADAATALDIADTIDWEDTHQQERIGLLTLASVIAKYDPLRARRTLDRYDALPSGMDSLLEMNGDVRLDAYRDVAAGRVARSQGDLPSARASLLSAARRYRALGFPWREAVALLDLSSVGVSHVPEDLGRASCVEAAAHLIHLHCPNSVVTRRLGPWKDAVYRSLTESQRTVLHEVLRGGKLRDIAKRTDREYNTVRNKAGQLLKAFRVNSTPALFAECHRRGIVAESTATDADSAA